MARHNTFTFRVDDEERAMVTRLARKLQRTESDAVRWLVINAIKQMDNQQDITPEKADE